jgi:hypothetical protein
MVTVNYSTTDSLGKIRKCCTLSSGATVMWKFNSEPTAQQLLDLETQYNTQYLYDAFPQEVMNVYDETLVFKDFVNKVQSQPTITLSQYNTYLGLKPWYEQACIRYFVYKIGTQLAKDKYVTLSDYSESVLLAGVRNYIVATPIAKLAKILGFNV